MELLANSFVTNLSAKGNTLYNNTVQIVTCLSNGRCSIERFDKIVGTLFSHITKQTLRTALKEKMQLISEENINIKAHADLCIKILTEH